MAKTDCNLYYTCMQKQYQEAKQLVLDLQELAEQGYGNEDNLEQAIKDMHAAKIAYDTATSFMIELNRPKDDKKLDKTKRDWYATLTGNRKKGIYDENVNVLDDLRRIVTETKEKK